MAAMATFVLVHGGWGGGWEWRLVANQLEPRGHTVYRPTLTGLGERSHLASPAVDLETHIADVIGVLDAEDLDDVVLVGQSYGGAVVTGVADRLPGRLRNLVYLDAFVPHDGESVNDLSPPQFVARVRQMAASEGDGWQVPLPFSADDFGYPPDIARWYIPRLCPHPLATLEQPLRLTGAINSVPRTFISCAVDDGSLFHRFGQRARDEGWDYRSLPVGHDAQVLAPDRVAQALAEIAAAQ
jgi:pimeloyl-ACP methyl ester carboxylesterase